MTMFIRRRPRSVSARDNHIKSIHIRRLTAEQYGEQVIQGELMAMKTRDRDPGTFLFDPDAIPTNESWRIPWCECSLPLVCLRIVLSL